ncbi:hypothetical protein STA3757_00660 [Stanieria sp. NIES-3757]|nr:hypothetical protein STA3757_00660 [Stanieria sp. NIES-3757]
MSDHQKNQPIDLSESKKPSHFLEQEAEKQPESEVESNQDFTYEQQSENQLAHEQSITAFVPGGGAIADLD